MRQRFSRCLHLAVVAMLLVTQTSAHAFPFKRRWLAQASADPNDPTALAANPGESGANSTQIPGRILSSGAQLNVDRISPNAQQLARQLNLMPLFYRLAELKAKVRGNDTPPMELRQDITETKEEIAEIIERAQMEVSFVQAEINDEQVLYADLLSSFTTTRDKTVAVTNAISFGTNGALWAVCEALAIPSAYNARFAIPSGIVGIPAGVVPSIASALTLKQVGGKRYSSPAAPNMLAKVFDRPTTSDIEYPKSVWDFLNAVPPGDEAKKTRREQIIDRWVSDKNIPNFTDRSSQQQIDLITATTDQNKSLTIALLNTRQVMLTQLGSEIFKMNRMLLELMLVLRGEKHI